MARNAQHPLSENVTTTGQLVHITLAFLNCGVVNLRGVNQLPDLGSLSLWVVDRKV